MKTAEEHLVDYTASRDFKEHAIKYAVWLAKNTVSGCSSPEIQEKIYDEWIEQQRQPKE